MLDVFKDKRDVMLAVKKWALVDMANAETYMENWASSNSTIYAHKYSNKN